MGLLGSILKSGFDLATTPLAVAADVVTLGGKAVDRREPFTISKLEQLAEDAEEVRDDLSDL